MGTHTNSKGVYVRPSLQRLGSISSLTAGGTGTMPEMMMATNLMMQKS